jgi:hypothetical protein
VCAVAFCAGSLTDQLLLNFVLICALDLPGYLLAGWLAELPCIGAAAAIAGLLAGSSSSLLTLAIVGTETSAALTTTLALVGKMFNAGACAWPTSLDDRIQQPHPTASPNSLHPTLLGHAFRRR